MLRQDPKNPPLYFLGKALITDLQLGSYILTTREREICNVFSEIP